MDTLAHHPAAVGVSQPWYDFPHAAMPMTVPLYVAGIYLADFEAIVTVYREPGCDWAVGSVEIVGQVLNSFSEIDARCEALRSNGEFVPGQREIETSRGPLGPTIETLVGSQIIRELELRVWMQKAEDLLASVERDWKPE